MSKLNKNNNPKKAPVNDPEEYEDKSEDNNSDLLSSDPEDAVLDEKNTNAQTDSTAANQSTLKKGPTANLKVVFNVADTKYPIVKYVGKKLFKWKLSYDNEEEFDILWTDSAVQPETLAKMQAFQKINHFPGTYSISRKNNLGRNLERMRRYFPDKYKFFPPTWILPAEWADFRSQFNKKLAKTFIVKPEASCQGRGIFLTRNFEDINPTEPLVAQRYLHKPFLIEGLKFDLRIYVLLAGCDPLRIFIYKEGLARFATEVYVPPKKDNMEDMCMHLTNYAINKNNSNFIFNEDKDKDDVGHKRSFTSILKYLENNNYDVPKLMREIKDLIIKTFCSVQPVLAHHYRGAQPENFHNNMCFEILGFDVMLDHKLKPWLIEVNHTPSFTVDTPFDKKVKKNVIHDTLKLMNINIKNRIKYKTAMKAEFQKRMQAGKKARLTPEEKVELHTKAQKERDSYESENMGSFEKIYPLEENKDSYDEFLAYAHKMWSEYTGSNIRRIAKKSTTELIKEKKPPVSNNASKLLKSKVQTSLEAGDKPKIAPSISNSTGSPNLKTSNSFTTLDQKKIATDGANNIYNIREEDDEYNIEKTMDRPQYLNIRSENQTPFPNISNVREEMYMDQDVLGEDEDREVETENTKNLTKQNEYRIRNSTKNIPTSSGQQQQTSQIKIKNLGAKLILPISIPQSKTTIPAQEKPILPSVGSGPLVLNPLEDKTKKDPRRFQSSEKIIRNSIFNSSKASSNDALNNGNFLMPKILEFGFLNFRRPEVDILGMNPAIIYPKTSNKYIATKRGY